jgi:Zn-dependent peptidase ImmA (M78 family)
MFKAREVALIAEQFGVSTDVLLEGHELPTPVQVAARLSQTDRTSVTDALDRAAFYADLAELLESHHVPKFDWLDLPDGVAWQQGDSIAKQVLGETGLDARPLPQAVPEFADLVEEALGIQVGLEPLGHGMDGLSVASEHFKLAMVSTATAPARQRWTLAHECAHLMLGDTQDLLVEANVWSGRGVQESRANAFAAAFLMPECLMRERWGEAVVPNEELISALLDTFHVSLDALAFRLHNLGLTNAAGRDRVRQMYPLVSLLRNRSQPNSTGTWVPGPLAMDAIKAYNEGRLGVRWLAELMRMRPDQLLNQLGSDDEEVDALEAVDDETLVG